MIWIRSTLYHLLFFIFTAVSCILALPSCALPRRYFMGVVHLYLQGNYALERFILGLDYEIRGQENLPDKGAYIVAAKHQSAYETLKLHFLFRDPAIILKRELLWIPIWGAFLKKSDVIAIDRSSREQAMASIADGAVRMQGQGRPLIIFPQGTRVSISESPTDKPYKGGIARMQETTHMPIIPLAMNSGYFAPKKGWCIQPGTVIFQFLPSIYPGLRRETLMAKLEKEIEETSNRLVEEAQEPSVPTVAKKATPPKRIPVFFWIVLLGALLFGAYSYYWFQVADSLRTEYAAFLRQDPRVERRSGALKISGFPGAMRAYSAEEFIQVPEGSLHIDGITATAWPLPAMPVRFETGPMTIKNFKYENPVHLDSVVATIKPQGQLITILDSRITAGDFLTEAKGDINLSARPYPDIALDVAVHNHEGFVERLVQDKFMKPRAALFVNAGFNALKTDGVVQVPVRIQDQTVFAGPLAIITLPDLSGL